MPLAVPAKTTCTDEHRSPVLQASPHWRNIDFISDLHLQANEIATFSAWQQYMETTTADAIFILGDLFEVWVGDDVIAAVGPTPTTNFEARCVEVLNKASSRLELFFIHGNRDFLAGPVFSEASGMTLLPDPTTLNFAGRHWLLSHGDALCLDDTDYMKFRAQVRSMPWQQEFLSKPLTERLEIAKTLRLQSEGRRSRSTEVEYTDLDSKATRQWLQTARANTLIHGHTHRPAIHDLSDAHTERLQRIVLSDWDVSANPARAEILRISAVNGPQSNEALVQRIPLITALAGS